MCARARARGCVHVRGMCARTRAYPFIFTLLSYDHSANFVIIIFGGGRGWGGGGGGWEVNSVRIQII